MSSDPQAASANQRDAYTVNEAWRKLPISRNAFYKGVRSGEIPSVRIGKTILIPKAPFHRKFGGEAA